MKKQEDKIKKLLALSTSDNIGEATTALMQAKKLAVKHSIDLDAFKEQMNKSEITSHMFDYDKFEYNAKAWYFLFQTIAENNKCVCLFGRLNKKTLKNCESTYLIDIKGYEEDADDVFEMCNVVWEYLSDYMRVNKITSETKFIRSFNQGCSDAYKELKEDIRETYSSETAIQSFSVPQELYNGTSTSTSSYGGGVDKDAYQLGKDFAGNKQARLGGE